MSTLAHDSTTWAPPTVFSHNYTVSLDHGSGDVYTDKGHQVHMSMWPSYVRG
jgi:hypothetical protein